MTFNETIQKETVDGVQSLYHIQVISLQLHNETTATQLMSQQKSDSDESPLSPAETTATSGEAQSTSPSPPVDDQSL